MSIFWLDCESHRYGLNCSFDCGHCQDGKPCSTVTGNCFDGCEDEWTGKLCDIGIYHTYFYQKTAHTCISNPTHLNIIIIVSFYYITIFFFTKECKNGTYVSNGKCIKCQGLCKDRAPCNKSTGKCDNGCDDHWTGKFCEGTYT